MSSPRGGLFRFHILDSVQDVADQKKIEEEAFERGRRVGRLEAFGPKGIPRKPPLLGAEFEFRTSYLDSFVQYERDVMANLRHLQMLRWGSEGETPLAQLEREVREELERARGAVDSELRRRGEREEVVAAIRASPHPPSSVREYVPEQFIAEDDRRGEVQGSGRVELGGADYGVWWSLEHPFKRWLSTRWRISWLCIDGLGMSIPDEVDPIGSEATAEVYALEILDRGTRREPARVWLLGTLRKRTSVERVFEGPIMEAMRERNSLIVAAEAVARAQREEEGPERL